MRTQPWVTAAPWWTAQAQAGGVPWMPNWSALVEWKPIQRSPRGPLGPIVGLFLPLLVLWYWGLITLLRMLN